MHFLHPHICSKALLLESVFVMNDSCSVGRDYEFGEPGHLRKKKMPWLSEDITISFSGVG